MRHQKEIEGIFRVLHEFDSRIKDKYDVLNNLNWEGNRKNNELASLGHILASMNALFKLRDETFMLISRLSKLHMADSDEDIDPCTIPELTFRVKVHKKVLQKLDESKNLTDICSQKLMDLGEEVRSILTNSGRCDPADLYPHLEKGNQDQIVILNMILEWIYPNGRSHCSNPTVIETESTTEATTELPNMPLDSKVIENEAPKNDMETVDLKTQDTQLDPKQKPMPENVIESEAPKNDMITVDLNTQDTQLDPKQKPITERATEAEAPKNDMVTVDLNTHDTQLDPKPNPMPKKTMTPRHKFKRIKKGGKVQKIQSPGVHTMNFNPSHKITDSQNTPIKSPNISCDSTILDTGIPKGDSSKMVLEVQDTKQNYKTKALKMPKGSMPQMSLTKRREKSGNIKKIQTPRRYKKKLKSQLDMTTQGSLKSKHNNNERLHNKTFNTKFMALRDIMKSVMGVFHNTFRLLDRLLLKRPRVKIK